MESSRDAKPQIICEDDVQGFLLDLSQIQQSRTQPLAGLSCRGCSAAGVAAVGLCTATCTREDLGERGSWCVCVWRVGRDWCTSCPPCRPLRSLLSYCLSPTALTTDGCTEWTCISPNCVMGVCLWKEDLLSKTRREQAAEGSALGH